MATSGSKSVTVTSWDTLKFNWWIVSQNVANNTTVVGWNMQLVAGSSGKISSTASKDWSVTVNGTKYSGTNTVGIGNNATKTLASGQTTVAHNSDGSKSFSYSFSQEFGITFSGSGIGTKSGSGSGVLTTIPRATTPTLSASSANMGASITINTPRASSSFTHDLAYSFAGSGWVSIATGVGTSRSWAVPDLATRIPNATSGVMTIRCITKNGSTTVGTKTVLLTVKVPASVVPTISAVTLAEATAGLAAQFGAYIQNKSKVKATITASGAKGSTIKSYSTTFQGKTHSGNSWTSGLLTKSGSLSMVTKVTDSRGRTASKTTTLTVLAYTAPKVTGFVVRRVDAQGKADSEGTLASFSYAYSVASLGGKNTAAMTITYKKSTETAWSSSILNGSDLDGSGIVLSSQEFPTDYQYDLRIQVVDWFGATSTYTAVLPSGAVILDIRADGLGIAFGKTSELAGVEFGWSPKGAVFGLGEAMEAIPANANLNDYIQIGIYSCSSNTTVKTLYNRPTDFGFTMRVYSALGNKDTAGSYWYLLQEVRPYQAAEPTYRRTLTRNSSGVWSVGKWMADTVSEATTLNAK